MSSKKVGVAPSASGWDRALSLEPGLAELEKKILALPDPLPDDLSLSVVWSGCADRVGIKPRLSALVG